MWLAHRRQQVSRKWSEWQTCQHPHLGGVPWTGGFRRPHPAEPSESPWVTWDSSSPLHLSTVVPCEEAEGRQGMRPFRQPPKRRIFLQRNSPCVTQETFQPTKAKQSVTRPNPGTSEGRTSFVIPRGGCRTKTQGDSSREIEGTPQNLRDSQCESVRTRYRTRRCGGRSRKHCMCNSVHRPV
jgi:hypothetical protein